MTDMKKQAVLFTKLDLPLAQAADRIIEVALPTYDSQVSDGLNIGGGTYTRFANGETEIILVCNDEMHPDVFLPSHKEFPYYCYVYRGSPAVLDAMRSCFITRGIQCEFGERP